MNVLNVASSFFDGNCVNLACQAEPGSGDVDGDGVTNILDLVAAINGILGTTQFTVCDELIADIDSSGGIPDVLDIVQLVELVVGAAP